MQFDLLHDILVCWATEERTLSYMLSAQKAKRLEHVFIWKVERTSRPEYPDPDLQSSHSLFHYFRLRWHELRILDIELVDIARVELPSGSTPKLWGVLTLPFLRSASSLPPLRPSFPSFHSAILGAQNRLEPFWGHFWTVSEHVKKNHGRMGDCETATRPERAST